MEETELLRVYITSMVVTATGTLVLKCSLLKKSVACNSKIKRLYKISIKKTMINDLKDISLSKKHCVLPVPGLRYREKVEKWR